MSIWTHAAGIIRVNSTENIDFEPIIGKVLRWESPIEEWDEAESHPENFTPYGSEGGIDYVVYTNPHDYEWDKYAIAIFGDLRNYENVEEIKIWFENILYNKSLMIRDAVLSIDNEHSGKTIVEYQNIF